MREDTDKQLAKVRAKMLLPCCRRRIAPMINCSLKATYWGWKLQDAGADVAKLLGVEGDYIAQGIDAAEAEEVLERISKNGVLNARQAVEAAKGAFGEGTTPAFPPDVQHEQGEEGRRATDVVDAMQPGGGFSQAPHLVMGDEEDEPPAVADVSDINRVMPHDMPP